MKTGGLIIISTGMCEEEFVIKNPHPKISFKLGTLSIVI
jgi:hypothetical protein